MKTITIISINDDEYLVPDERDAVAIIKCLVGIKPIKVSGYGKDKERIVMDETITVGLSMRPATDLIDMTGDVPKAPRPDQNEVPL